MSSKNIPGDKKTATAVAYCKRGHGVLRVNGRPLDLVEPRLLQYKLQEPILLLGKEKFSGVVRIIKCLFYIRRYIPWCSRIGRLSRITRTAIAYCGVFLQNLTFWLHYY